MDYVVYTQTKEMLCWHLGKGFDVIVLNKAV